MWFLSNHFSVCLSAFLPFVLSFRISLMCLRLVRFSPRSRACAHTIHLKCISIKNCLNKSHSPVNIKRIYFYYYCIVFLFLFSFCFMCSYSRVRSLLPFRSFSVLSCVRYYIHKIHVLLYGFIGWFACSYNTYVWGASTQHTFMCARNCFWWRDRQSLPLIQLFGPMQNLWTIHDTLILWNVTYLQ